MYADPMKRLFALAFCLELLLCSGSAYSESWYENLGYEGDLQVTAGYSRFSADGKEKADFTWDGIGCGADLQIKFFFAPMFIVCTYHAVSSLYTLAYPIF